MDHEITEFSLQRISGDIPHAKLLWHGHDSGVLVDGVVLEKQFSIPSGYILFITEDCPFEEGLHIYYLSKERKLLDSIEISQPYTPGILKDVVVKDRMSLSFHFIGEREWLLRILEKPKWKLGSSNLWAVKFKSLPIGKHWLEIQVGNY